MAARCPLLDVAGGQQPFPIVQQVIDVGRQVGKVGDVGAEVVTAGTTEPERARVAARLDVGRLGAGPEGDGDLADGTTDVLGVEQRLRRSPKTVAETAELHLARQSSLRGEELGWAVLACGR